MMVPHAEEIKATKDDFINQPTLLLKDLWTAILAMKFVIRKVGYMRANFPCLFIFLKVTGFRRIQEIDNAVQV